MKHYKSTLLKSRYPTDIYYKRIIEMMRDYDVTMQDAILWDMCGFMPFASKGMILSFEEEIDYYLHMNHIPSDSRTFFSGVALGLYDYNLVEDEKEAEQEDDRSADPA